jgi:hypothetical protein
MKYKLIAAAILAAGVSNVANATITLPSSDVNNTGGSELILNLWDGTNTFTLDLGVPFGAPTTGTLANLSTLAPTFFTGGTLNSNVQWNVIAADTTAGGNGSTLSTYGARMMTTSSTATWSYVNSNVTASASGLASYITALNTTGTHPTVANGSDLSTSVLDSNSWQGSGMLTAWAQNSLFNAMGMGAGSMLFVEVAQSATTGLFGPQIPTTGTPSFTTLGQFTLAANGAMSFAPVPVPAAVWLFGSALAGLVGVARRRKASV